MSFLKRVSSSFTSSFLGGGGGGRFARRRLTTDGSKEKKSLGVVRRSINYTNLLLVTKETALAKYASLFAQHDAQKENFVEDNKEDKKLGGGSKVRWDRLKLRHEAHENAVAKGIPCDFDSFFLFPIVIERERERRKGFGLRDDDVPLMSSIMSQKNFKIEEIMVVRGQEESVVALIQEASTKALRDGETTLLFGTRRTRAKANDNNNVSLSFSDPFYYSLSLSLFSRCQL